MVTISRVVPPSASHARSPPFLSRSSAGVCRRRAPQLTNTRASRSSPLRESRKLATFTAVEARSSHHHVEFWRSALWPSRADLNTVLEYGTKGGAMRRAGAAVVGDHDRLAPRQGGARRISRRLAPPPLPDWGSARAVPSAAADAREPTLARVLLNVSSLRFAAAGGRRRMRLTPARGDVVANVALGTVRNRRGRGAKVGRRGAA